MDSPDSRVDFAFAEALAFGTLALHRGFRPPSVPGSEAAPPAEEHPQARLELAAAATERCRSRSRSSAQLPACRSLACCSLHAARQFLSCQAICDCGGSLRL